MAGLEYDAMEGLEETGPRVTVREVSFNGVSFTKASAYGMTSR